MEVGDGDWRLGIEDWDWDWDWDRDWLLAFRDCRLFRAELWEWKDGRRN